MPRQNPKQIRTKKAKEAARKVVKAVKKGHKLDDSRVTAAFNRATNP